MLEPNGEDVPRAGEELNRGDGELAPNVDVDDPKIEGGAADVEVPNADELKAGVDDVPKPVLNAELFAANGLDGVEVEKGLAAD